MSKSRNVCFTTNNPTLSAEQFKDKFEQWSACTFVVFQEECGESGTRHFQGYAEFSTSVSWSQFALHALQSHCEARRGSQEQAVAYASKDDTRVAGPWRWGEPRVSRQGARNDLKAFISDVRNGARLRELLDTHPSVLARYPRLEASVRGAYPPAPHAGGRRVILHFGPPGSGKTRAVHESASECDGRLYVMPINGSSFWLDGYDGQPVALLDDFGGRASKLGLTEALRLLDRYPVRAPVKGSFVWWNPEVVHVTTNIHPTEWYDYSKRVVHFEALKRRFAEVLVYEAVDVSPLSIPKEDGFSWDDWWKQPPQVGAPEAHSGGSPYFQ